MDSGISVDDLINDHHTALAELRRHSPIAWVPGIDGWVVTTRQLAAAVMRDADTFTVDDPRFSTAQVIGPSMLSLDGAAHARHRNPFADAYRPAIVTARFGEAIIEVARSLVSGLAPHGAGELRRQLAGPLAVSVVALSLGLDEIDADDLLGWYDRIVAAVERISIGQAIDPGAATAFADLSDAVMASVDRSDSVVHGVAAKLDRGELVSNVAVFLFGGAAQGLGEDVHGLSQRGLSATQDVDLNLRLQAL